VREGGKIISTLVNGLLLQIINEFTIHLTEKTSLQALRNILRKPATPY